MIESLQFRKFKALRNTILPLGRFTVILGANGSGKSTALSALQALQNPSSFSYSTLISAEARSVRKSPRFFALAALG